MQSCQVQNERVGRVKAFMLLLTAFSSFLLGSMNASADLPDSSLNPSDGLYLRAIKQPLGADPNYENPNSNLEEDGLRSNWDTGALEAWIWSPSEQKYKLYKTYSVAGYRGLLGPKTRRGDHQVPEGFYSVNALNPHSKYGGKGLWVDYPNQHDVKQTPRWSGSDIEIHGDFKSAGCLAMGEQIQEIYSLAEKAMKGGQKRVPLHIFPFHMTEENMDRVRGEKWFPFWQQLKQGYDAFETHRVPPLMEVDPQTRDYVLSSKFISPLSKKEKKSNGPAQAPDLASKSISDRKALVDQPIIETQVKEVSKPQLKSVLEPSLVAKVFPVFTGQEFTGVQKPPIAEERVVRSPSSSAEGNHSVCENALKTFFGDEKNRDRIQKYLRVQGQLSLHRLAWSYLKTQDSKTEKVEKTIERLLIERDPELHKKFVNENSQSAKRSQNELVLSGLESLRMAVEKAHGQQEGNRPYLLKYSDMKMMGLLVDTEKKYGNRASGGVIDFVNMINSSYRGRLASKQAQLTQAEKTVERLRSEMKKIADELERYLVERGCTQPVQTLSCADGAMNSSTASFLDLLEQSSTVQSSIAAALAERQEDIREANRWGKYWLHVK